MLEQLGRHADAQNALNDCIDQEGSKLVELRSEIDDGLWIPDADIKALNRSDISRRGRLVPRLVGFANSTIHSTRKFKPFPVARLTRALSRPPHWRAANSS